MTVLLLLLSSSHTQAATFKEKSDAGEAINSAQTITSGAEDLDVIVGSLSEDADLFKVFLEGGKTFSATTLNLETLTQLPGDIFAGFPTDVLADPQLFLFDIDGKGIYANDDTSFSTQASLASGDTFTPTQSGYYYLGISSSGYNPISNDGNPIFGTTGTGSNLALSGFQGTSSSGRYAIALTGVKAAQTGSQSIPEFSPVLGLLALGALGASQLQKKHTHKQLNNK